jgi:predicted transcriptional regulator YdeE
MNQALSHLPEIRLMGITARTSNAAEMNPATAQIGATMQRFFTNNLPNQIPNRKQPGKIFAVYTDYESDVNGPYTYFLGEEVTTLDTIPEGFTTLTIPAQLYAKFTSLPGQMPDVVIQLWQKIWGMNAHALGGHRAYKADFEIYDERSHDMSQAVVDIFIGLEG